MKKSLPGIVLCLLELAFGVLLLINAEAFTSIIITVVGAALIIFGGVSVIKYFRTEPELASAGQYVFKGLIMIAGGAFCAIKAPSIVTGIELIAVVYGIAILLLGFTKIQSTLDMVRQKSKKWFFPLIGAVICLACGVIVILNPFEATGILWIFLGVALIVEALSDLVTLIVRAVEKKKESKEAAPAPAPTPEGAEESK